MKPQPQTTEHPGPTTRPGSDSDTCSRQLLFSKLSGVYTVGVSGFWVVLKRFKNPGSYHGDVGVFGLFGGFR